MPKNPTFRRLKRKGRADGAVVELDGRRVYLGRFDDPASRQRYHTLLAEWIANGRRAPIEAADDLTVCELCDRFLPYADGYYRRPDGSATTEPGSYRQAIAKLTTLYGREPAADFSPRKLETVRASMIGLGWCRRHVNGQVSRIRRLFRWAVSQELVEPHVYGALSAVDGLKRGRSTVRESEPVTPVPDAHIEAVRPFVSRHVWGLIQFQLLTGCRPGEACALRLADVDCTRSVWVYAPRTHKTSHHGHARRIAIGPRAQAVLRPFMAGRALDAPIFSPIEAEAERRADLHAKRVTPAGHGNEIGTNRKPRPEREPGEAYTRDSYRRAIQRACVDAGVPSWHPHQLRHNCATRLREAFGLDIAQTALGHRVGSLVTESYAAASFSRVEKAIARVG